uniref:ATPase 11, plasma membrane-type n=1 Tax=Anthurium amnicola TaxID=1678845 RepID=A0A1D1YTW2_9ARAE
MQPARATHRRLEVLKLARGRSNVDFRIRYLDCSFHSLSCSMPEVHSSSSQTSGDPWKYSHSSPSHSNCLEPPCESTNLDSCRVMDQQTLATPSCIFVSLGDWYAFTYFSP